MEPVDLKSPPPEDDQLETWLRANATAKLLPDDGFTRRVLTSLPPPAKAGMSRRAAFCLAGALAGVLLPWLTGTRLPDVAANAVEGRRLALAALQQLADPNLLRALVVTGACLLYVFTPRGLRPHR